MLVGKAEQVADSNSQRALFTDFADRRAFGRLALPISLTLFGASYTIQRRVR